MPEARSPGAAATDDPRPAEVAEGRVADAAAVEAEDAERPGRRLPPRLAAAVGVVAAALSAFVLIRVFVPDPSGALPYRITFLGVVLPLVFVCFPARRARPAAAGDAEPGRRTRREDPRAHRPLDPRLAPRRARARRLRPPADGLRRVRRPRRQPHHPRPGRRRGDDAARPRGDTTHHRLGAARDLPRLPAPTPTTAVAAAGLVDRARRLRQRIVERSTWPPRASSASRSTSPRRYIVLFTIYGAVLDASGAGALLPRPVASPRSAARAPPRVGRSRWPASCSAPSRARARRPRSAWARCPGRSCAAPGYPRAGRRGARRRGHRRHPLAADARRGRVHHRRVPADVAT